jgi:hypothetical protein
MKMILLLFLPVIASLHIQIQKVNSEIVLNEEVTEGQKRGHMRNQVRWLTPRILATSQRWRNGGQSGQKVLETLFQPIARHGDERLSSQH